MFMTDRRHRGTVPGDDVRPHAERCGHAAGTSTTRMVAASLLERAAAHRLKELAGVIVLYAMVLCWRGWPCRGRLCAALQR